MKEQLKKLFTTHGCMVFVLIIAIISSLPMPDKWNVAIDARGQTVADLIYFVSFYLILAICFLSISITTGNILAKMFFWLAWGKIIDQFWNPYEYHLSEIIWDLTLIGWTLYREIKCRKKMPRS